ncbi:agmatine deiminase family protein [Shimia abyssi]|uniref:Agmatine deiminase n=1 Tax=Shimia abyssi TaxID=1662395 RepID=A0A2P8FJS6_9RHOB|nr:agmatine deiminase family protein [Shimia abyssi]PSL21960.1 agmatine deiminase [Shimia abyssi]
MNRRDLLASGGAIAAVGLFENSAAKAETGLFVPREEGPHQRTFMQWPVSRRVHRDRVFLDMTQQTIADIANAIAEFEPVAMLADSNHHSGARERLSANVELWDIPTEDLWCRDSGPIFAIDSAGKLAVTHVQFNGWGEKQMHRHDSQIAARVAKRLGLELVSSGLRGEGGGVEHDGHGLLMAHESSWVNDNRNPNLSRSEIEARLLTAYGADRVIWSEGVWGEDITDYHIDSLARFTGARRVLINLPDEPDMTDPFHVAALDTHDILVAEGLEVDVIPEPEIRRVNSSDFVASYANYYACNGAIIAAQFGDPEADQIARAALSRHYPGREIVMLNVDPLGESGGGIHCATQQMPAA